MSAAAEVEEVSSEISNGFDDAAVAAINQAIIAANYAQNGVVFEPFHVLVTQGSVAFSNMWNSERGDTPITFLRYNTGSTGQYLPLGDIAVIGSPAPAPPGVMLFAPSAAHPDALAHPTGFQWILDDSGSGNPRDISYFRMIAPPGYSPVGICFSGGDVPDAQNYWCVKNQYLQAVTYQTFWSDSGSHWKQHNGNLNAPSFAGNPPTASPGKMIMLPPTFLSDEDSGNEGAFGLVVASANLPIQTFQPPAPVYNPDIVDGDTTTCGVTSVKVLPYTAVSADAGYLGQSITSPFYYVAAEPYWVCMDVFPTPKGGSFTEQETIGTSESQATTQQQTTSLTIGAEVGVEYGPASASVSTSFTKEFSLTVERTENHSSETTNTVTINYPEQPVTWTWQRQTQIALFRTDLSQLPPATYGNSDLRFVPAGAQELRRERGKRKGHSRRK